MKLNEVQLFPKAQRHPAGQRQDALNDQLRDLIRLAIKNGMYDAADFLERHVIGKKRGPDTQLPDNGPKFR